MHLIALRSTQSARFGHPAQPVCSFPGLQYATAGLEALILMLSMSEISSPMYKHYLIFANDWYETSFVLT